MKKTPHQIRVAQLVGIARRMRGDSLHIVADWSEYERRRAATLKVLHQIEQRSQRETQMFKNATRHGPRPERSEDARCPHGRVEGLQPCPDCAAAWRQEKAKPPRWRNPR